MLILGGSDDYVGGADGWTVRSANGRRAAHSEHTIAIMITQRFPYNAENFLNAFVDVYYAAFDD